MEIDVVFKCRAPGSKEETIITRWRVSDPAEVPQIGQIVPLETEEEGTREYGVVHRATPENIFAASAQSVDQEIILIVGDVEE